MKLAWYLFSYTQSNSFFSVQATRTISYEMFSCADEDEIDLSAFWKEFGAQGWFTGTVVKIMKDGDRRCIYSDGDVEDLLLDDLVQLAKLDPANNVVSSSVSTSPIS
jgi:hypothetical protein